MQYLEMWNKFLEGLSSPQNLATWIYDIFGYFLIFFFFLLSLNIVEVATVLSECWSADSESLS